MQLNEGMIYWIGVPAIVAVTLVTSSSSLQADPGTINRKHLLGSGSPLERFVQATLNSDVWWCMQHMS